MNNEFLYAYFAGVIDSDGYITINRVKKNKKLPSGNVCTGIYHSLKVGIAGTEPQSHEKAKEIFGGSLCRYEPKNNKHKAQYQWCLSNDKATDFLLKIKPFLLIKPLQAELGIEFQKLLKNHKDTRLDSGKFSASITKPMADERDVFWEKMIELNNSRNRIRSGANTKRLLDGKEYNEYPKP